MPASLDDILTAQKNGVIALNSIQQSLSSEVATTTTAVATSSTFVIAGKGRLLRFSVLVAGTAVGFVYNSATPSGGSSSNALVACPNMIGVYEANVVFDSGLVIAPGSGQSISVTYLLG
jgi:hypothetical protein